MNGLKRDLRAGCDADIYQYEGLSLNLSGRAHANYTLSKGDEIMKAAS